VQATSRVYAGDRGIQCYDECGGTSDRARKPATSCPPRRRLLAARWSSHHSACVSSTSPGAADPRPRHLRCAAASSRTGTAGSPGFRGRSFAVPRACYSPSGRASCWSGRRALVSHLSGTGSPSQLARDADLSRNPGLVPVVSRYGGCCVRDGRPDVLGAVSSS
jgi:hypothetical protein